MFVLFVLRGIDRSFSGDVFTAVTQSDSLPIQSSIPIDSDKPTTASSLILALDGYINKILEDVKSYLQSIFPLYYR